MYLLIMTNTIRENTNDIEEPNVFANNDKYYKGKH